MIFIGFDQFCFGKYVNHTKLYEYIKFIIIQIYKVIRIKSKYKFSRWKSSKRKCIYNSLSLLMLDAAIRVNKKHYLQSLLEECKHEIKKN